MDAFPNIRLPGERHPVRDIFSEGGKHGAGAYFLKVGFRIGNLMDPMSAQDRHRIYMEEIPMGYKVLFDLEAIYTSFGNESGERPSFRPEIVFLRPEKNHFLVLYEKQVEFPAAKVERMRGGHYRDRKHKAIEDADQLAKAWGMKIAVARIEWVQDWH